MDTNYNIKVSRYTDIYPSDNPDSIIIGFTVSSCVNHRSLYKETRVFYHELRSHSQTDENIILNIAWKKLEPFFHNWCNDIKKKTKVVGMTFNPNP